VNIGWKKGKRVRIVQEQSKETVKNMCEVCDKIRDERIARATLTRSIEFYEDVIAELNERIHELERSLNESISNAA
jgi:vacuolar-type H+-ATPase subunit I/STV1